MEIYLQRLICDKFIKNMKTKKQIQDCINRFLAQSQYFATQSISHTKPSKGKRGRSTDSTSILFQRLPIQKKRSRNNSQAESYKKQGVFLKSLTHTRSSSSLNKNKKGLKMRKEKTSLGKIKLKKGKSESKQKDFEKLLQRTKSLIKFYRSESKNLILENEQLEKVNEKLKMGKTQKIRMV